MEEATQAPQSQPGWNSNFTGECVAVTHWEVEKFAAMMQEKVDEPGLAHWNTSKTLPPAATA